MLSAGGALYLVTWDASHAQLAAYEWPEAVRYKGADSAKDAVTCYRVGAGVSLRLGLETGAGLGSG